MKVEFRIRNKKDCDYAMNVIKKIKEAYRI